MFQQGIVVFSLVKYAPANYGSYYYPLWADMLGWVLSLASILPIFVMGIWKFYKAPGDTAAEVKFRVQKRCNTGRIRLS